MKKKGLVLLIIMMLFSLFGCSSIKVIQKDVGLDDIKASINTISLKKNEKTGYTLIEAKVKLTGNNDKGIVAVYGLYHFLDANDNETDTARFYYIRANKPIEKDETIIVDDGFQAKIEGNVKKVYLEITEVEDIDELPPKHLPEVGENLYQALNSENINHIKENLPTKVVYTYDQMGFRTYYTVEDPESIQKVVNAFTNITIKAETFQTATDSYNSITFSFGDKESYVSFMHAILEVNVYNDLHYYELNGLGEFTKLMAELGVKTTD